MDDKIERGHVVSDSHSDIDGNEYTNADATGDGDLLAEADVNGKGSKHSVGSADGEGILESTSHIDDFDANSQATSTGGDGVASANAETLDPPKKGFIQPGGLSPFG